MKPTPEQIDSIRAEKDSRDWESFHSAYDKLVEQRLRELDPEFMDELDKVIEGGTFWYA